MSLVLTKETLYDFKRFFEAQLEDTLNAIN